MQATNSHEKDRQWIRKCSVVVGNNRGSGLDLGELRITFATKKGDTETPNSVEIRVYNLSEGTLSRVQKEFSRVILIAGYENNAGIIFDGNIRSTRIGRDSGCDTWLEIIAADGDRAYNFATLNTTLAAGSKAADRIKACQNSFNQKGAGKGEIPELDGTSLPRGKVMYGMARKFMRDEAKTSESSWSFQDGKMQMIKNKGYLSGEAVLLTSETGLIGTPEQTNDGIKVRALLNPKLRVGGRIKLNNKSIQEAKTDLKRSAKRPPKISNDGFYRILKLEFSGDTRGNDWFADMICIGLDDTSRLPLDLV